jgi:hypothetical protein
MEGDPFPKNKIQKYKKTQHKKHFGFSDRAGPLPFPSKLRSGTNFGSCWKLEGYLNFQHLLPNGNFLSPYPGFAWEGHRFYAP